MTEETREEATVPLSPLESILEAQQKAEKSFAALADMLPRGGGFVSTDTLLSLLVNATASNHLTISWVVRYLQEEGDAMGKKKSKGNEENGEIEPGGPFHLVNTTVGKHCGPFTTEMDARMALSINTEGSWLHAKLLNNHDFKQWLVDNFMENQVDISNG